MMHILHRRLFQGPVGSICRVGSVGESCPSFFFPAELSCLPHSHSSSVSGFVLLRPEEVSKAKRGFTSNAITQNGRHWSRNEEKERINKDRIEQKICTCTGFYNKGKYYLFCLCVYIFYKYCYIRIKKLEEFKIRFLIGLLPYTASRWWYVRGRNILEEFNPS